MSASLVGSEMCIRDSPQHAPHDAARAYRTCARARSRWTRPARIGPPPSVSYTHLTLPTICSV
eukprot:5517400-Alexandrium_andersonii.AAC.1